MSHNDDKISLGYLSIGKRRISLFLEALHRLLVRILVQLRRVEPGSLALIGSNSMSLLFLMKA